VNLRHCRDAYYDYSRRTSDVARSLAFAGIAIIWVFRSNIPGETILPRDLAWPGILIVVSLGLDLIHYVTATVIWGVFSRRKEREGVGDAEFEAPRWINWPTNSLFAGKLLFLAGAYLLLIRYLWGRLFRTELLPTAVTKRMFEGSLTDALLVFYAVFWGAMLASVTKFQPFDTRWKGKQWKTRLARFALAVVLFNALPILGLVAVMSFQMPNTVQARHVAAAAVASLSLFGLPRIFHGIIAVRRPIFYHDSDWSTLKEHPPLASADEDHWWLHLGPGLGYVAVSFLIAGLLASDW
jgi:hypothetical protein